RGNPKPDLLSNVARFPSMTCFLPTAARIWIVCAAALTLVLGCSQQQRFIDTGKQAQDNDQKLLQQVSYDQPVEAPDCGTQAAGSVPFALDRDSSTIEYWDLDIDQVIQMALSCSTVMRDLGGRIIQAPNTVPTIYGPSIQSTDPRFGEEAALSAFDAQFA